MLVTSHITADLTQKDLMQYVYATQDDSNTRAIEIALTANGAPWTVPAGVTGAVSFRKPDKTAGIYDTLPDGTTAVTFKGSNVTAILAPQVLTAAGDVALSVAFYDAALNKLGTFPITVRVQHNPAAGQDGSTDYYYLTSFAAVNNAIGNLNSLQTSKRSSLVDAINELVSSGTGSGGTGGEVIVGAVTSVNGQTGAVLLSTLPNPYSMTIGTTTYSGASPVDFTSAVQQLIDNKLAALKTAEGVSF
jgi:hypothetical protein